MGIYLSTHFYYTGTIAALLFFILTFLGKPVYVLDKDLLNCMHLQLIKLVEPEEPRAAGAGPPGPAAGGEADDDEWKVMGPRNRGAVERRWAARRTPVADIFRGRTRLRLHRAAHHDVTDAVQPFFTLQLDIEVCHYPISLLYMKEPLFAL